MWRFFQLYGLSVTLIDVHNGIDFPCPPGSNIVVNGGSGIYDVLAFKYQEFLKPSFVNIFSDPGLTVASSNRMFFALTNSPNSPRRQGW